MCLKYVKIDNSNPAGCRSAFVPCGYCVDCRRKVQQAWQFRLVAEAAELKKRGWNIAFCTLTFEDTKLPHIPSACFKDSAKVVDIPCFNRSLVTDFVVSLRNHFKAAPYRFVGDNRLRYFIASEYGSLRHRPHHHMILAWPPSVSYKDMHAVCSKAWTSGFLFPRDYRGDGDCLSFEVVGDPSKVFRYVSKYACKDIDYYNATKDIDFYDGEYEEGTEEYTLSRLYRNCKPFHLQSKSLGFEAIRDLPYEKKRDIYVNGLSFFGDGEVYSLPLYLKHKLIFDNYYIVDANGERLCRRKASAFFDRYKTEIFEEKSKFYTSLILQSQDFSYFTRRGVSSDVAHMFVSRISYYKSRLDSVMYSSDPFLIGKLFLAYYGLNDDYHFSGFSLCDMWYLRYRTPDDIESLRRRVPIEDSIYPLSWLNQYFDAVVQANTYVGVSCVGEREKQDERLRRIRDFFNNQVR